ncbi:MAG: protein kinase domain-containing protein, partial [Bryobacteraceae bacterium]
VRADTATTVTQTAAGMIVGSVAYMSPEQAESRLTDHRADVFSFGAVLYEMATGRRAFHGDTHASTLAAVLKGEPVPLRTLAPASPAALDRIVRRCLRKNRDERYPEMVAVRVGLLALTKPSARWRWVAAACALLAVAVAVALWPRPATNVEIALPKPVQLTVDLGDTGDPSLSPDGKWLAYVSDRGNTGQYGLWVQRLDGTEGRKVIECTFLGDPVFTPDGQTIIYACRDTPDPQQRDLYSINVDGTERKLVLKDGYWPSISPNGKYVAFLSRKTRRHAVLPLAGGEPIPLRPENYYGLGRAIWSPDSERLMIVNWRYSMEQGSRFWVASRDGSEAVETPLFDVLENAGYERGRQGSMLYSWTPTHIYLSFSAGGSRDVWRVPFDAQRGMPLGQATRITASTGAWNGIVQHGKLVFDASAFQSNLFALRLASDGRSVAAEPRQLTFDSTVNFLPMLSLDGRRVSYISQRARYHQLFVVDVASGRSLSITELPRSSRSMPFYCISPDGEHVAWADQGNVYRSRTDSPTRERVCSDCGYPLVWLPDGSGLLLRDKKARDTLFLYEFSSGRRRAILRARDHNLGQVSVSSDGGWLAFQAVQGVSMEGFIAPLGGALKEDMSEWIPVSKGINLTNFIWSARGDLLYAVDRGRRIVAIPLNRGTKYPSGPPVPVHELPKDSKQYIHRIAAADGLIVAYMESSHRNIWIQDLPK